MPTAFESITPIASSPAYIDDIAERYRYVSVGDRSAHDVVVLLAHIKATEIRRTRKLEETTSDSAACGSAAADHDVGDAETIGVDRLDSRVAVLERIAADANERLDERTKNVIALNARLDDHARKALTYESSIVASEKRIAALESGLNVLTDRLNDLDKRLRGGA